jgi:SMI1/KNR4 family protein SUKH-1
VENWETEIAKGLIIQDRIQSLDRSGMWCYHMPEPGATEEQILAVERQLGFQLDDKYREFLRHANGWRCFYQAVDLFGTRQLLGAAPMASAQNQLRAIDPDVFLADVGASVGDFLPVGASSLQSDIFLLARPSSSGPGAVVWFAGYLIDRFPCFDEFFLSMLDYNRQEIAYLEQEAKPQ